MGFKSLLIADVLWTRSGIAVKTNKLPLSTAVSWQVFVVFLNLFAIKQFFFFPREKTSYFLSVWRSGLMKGKIDDYSEVGAVLDTTTRTIWAVLGQQSHIWCPIVIRCLPEGGVCGRWNRIKFHSGGIFSCNFKQTSLIMAVDQSQPFYLLGQLSRM